ncbi:hypothetical protein CC1G_05404 [Coprinopsis cinerea okayama7|uniref:Peptidase M43 pregnancy-associated plasma-A domain-containing protein n=1 Tax=Coprinopsis cinerea (strain Okayama-7 / 130 / ATCC MYA-4618 / FGSC 9003) TaxID=240176 RepID=A8NPZ8_COPC7|nr:hypothetical protein CC1G_05404 [Coprinopsis cinerea okayama7\|eukprot:XP_001835442.2 hypothetical protein CC1G_05404 [Coprinopsis cinerea okayama7\
MLPFKTNFGFVIWNSDIKDRPSPCGTQITTADFQRTLDVLTGLSLHGPGKRQVGPAISHTFDVVWHIVASNISYAGGWVPDSQIDGQMNMLNRHYEGTGISWRHSKTIRILSPHWHEYITTNTTGLRSDMQRLFNEGGATTLNVYTLGFHRDFVNGYSSQPVDYLNNPKEDGVAIRFTTLPGGISDQRAGGTLTHESGHWLGLRHTFEGGCEGDGDGIWDTPAEASPAFGCPVGRDSCPDQPGLDPIYNFMDYTDEDCRSEFTPGQVDMMQAVIRAFRSNDMGTPI